MVATIQLMVKIVYTESVCWAVDGLVFSIDAPQEVTTLAIGATTTIFTFFASRTAGVG